MNILAGAIIVLVLAMVALFSSYQTESNIIRSCAKHNVYISQDVAMICKIAPGNQPEAKAQQNT
jgi:hypothetical protein